MTAALLLQRAIWTLNFIGSALIVWRLIQAGLYKTYRYFFAYILFAAIRTAVLLPFPPNGFQTYYKIWVATQPVLWIFYVLVVAELYYLVLREYRGIYSLGRWFLYGAVSVAVLISALTVLPTVQSIPVDARRPLPLYYYAYIERGLVTSLAVILLLLMLLVAWFPVPLSKNLLTHCAVYSAYFFANNVAVLYWQVGTGRQTVKFSTAARLSVALICYLCWVFLLSRKGEERKTSLKLGRNPLEEKRLLGQLETLNQTLLRTARK